MSATQGARACFYNAEQIARALGGKRSAGGYIAKCPAHQDRRPSLSIREVAGRVLFKCFAGCSQESVLQALKEEGLWSIKPPRPHQRVIDATYVYNDELGRPLNRVCRTTDKCFFQEHLVANGWIRGLGSRRVLYHLDEVLLRTLERVHVAEGEKDVDRLRSLGYLATCNPMGAGKWKEEYSAELAGRDVLIFFDNDSQESGFAGQHHACQVALSLIGVGCAVRIAELPIGKDVSEYLDFGGSMNEIELRAASSPPLSVIDIANWRSQFGVSSVSLPRDNHVETEWPDPLPFAVQEVCSMQSEVLPGQLGEYCASLAHSTETPPELSILAILGVLSTAVAGKVQIEAEASYIEPANIYVCAVLESGNRKTAVIDAVTRPLREYEAEEHRRILPEIARLESERKTRMAIIERLRKRVKDGDQALVERISTLEADLPSVPHLPVLFTSDSTAEKLEVLLQESDGHIALISDEGGLFDVMNGRYNKKPNLDVFLKGHCQAPLRVHRMGRTIAVDNPHVTILVSPQPGVLKGLQDFMRSRGLLARFLFVLPKSTVGNRKLIPSHISSELTTDYKRAVSKILDWRPSSTYRLRLAPDAYQVWKDFQMAVEEEMREGRRLCRLRDWGSKLPGACLRIATLLHVAAHAEKLPTLPGVTSKLEITSAVQICRSLISHAAAIFGMMSEDPIVTHSKRIFKWLVEDGRAEIPRRICFRAHQPHVFQNIQELDVCLNVLIQHRLLRVFERKTGGRSSEIIQLNPRLREADLEQVQISQVEK